MRNTNNINISLNFLITFEYCIEDIIFDYNAEPLVILVISVTSSIYYQLYVLLIPWRNELIHIKYH